MKDPGRESEHFLKLMWALQFYVNVKLNLHVNINNVHEYAGIANEKKVRVRDALFDDIGIVDDFVQENPEGFTEPDLMIVREWKNFVRGNFFIERVLKRYAVFIQDSTVYGVKSVSEDLDALAALKRLPLYIHAVLLPFKGKIIHDGFMNFGNMYFGSGIKSSLRENYMAAKQNGRIIETLESTAPGKREKKKPSAVKDWKPELDKLAGRARKLKGSMDGPAIYTPAFSLVKAGIEFAQIAVSDPEDHEGLYKALAKVRRAHNKASTVLSREESW